MKRMKVVKKKTVVKPVSLRFKEELIDKIDEIAGNHELSRQELISAILEKALSDKSFVVEIAEVTQEKS